MISLVLGHWRAHPSATE